MASVCQQFHANPGINPESGRNITIGGPTYQKLVKTCGPPPGPVPAYLAESIRPFAPPIMISRPREERDRAMVVIRGPYFNEAYSVPLTGETVELISNLQGINEGTFYMGGQALRGILGPYYMGKAGNQPGPFRMVINLEPEL